MKYCSGRDEDGPLPNAPDGPRGPQSPTEPGTHPLTYPVSTPYINKLIELSEFCSQAVEYQCQVCMSVCLSVGL